MDDLYSDLTEDVSIPSRTELESEVQNLQVHIRELQEVIKSHEKDAEDVRKHLDSVERENSILRANISSLYRTAKAEIDRKNQLVQESRKVPYQCYDYKERVVNSSNSKANHRNPHEPTKETISSLVQRNYDTIVEKNNQDRIPNERSSSLVQRNDDTIPENNQHRLPNETNSSLLQRNDDTILENNRDEFPNETNFSLVQRNDDTTVENNREILLNETDCSLVQKNDCSTVENDRDRLPNETNSSLMQKKGETIVQNHQDGFSNDLASSLEQRNDGTVVENYQDELSSTRKALKRLIDEILRKYDRDIRSCLSVDSREKSQERNSAVSLQKSHSVERNENSDYDTGLSVISSDSSSDDELRIHSRRLRKSKKKEKKKKKKATKKRKISSSATLTPCKRLRGESPS